MSPTFFFTNPPTSQIYTLSLHDALPISDPAKPVPFRARPIDGTTWRQWLVDDQREQLGRPDVLAFVSETNARTRSEEHTSELQSRFDLVCRLLLEKKKKNKRN